MLLLILVLAFGIYSFSKENSKKKENEYSFLPIVFLFVCIAYLSLCSTIIERSSYKQEFTEYDKIEIVALQNLSPLEGSFFLGSGYIGSVPYYFFYSKLDNGGKALGKLQAKSAVVYEEKRKDAYVAKVKEKRIFEKLNEWSWLLAPQFIINWLYETTLTHAAHVPIGTVKRGFNLDLKDFR